MATTESAPTSTERILIVEDDAAQRVGLQQLLKSWGYAVEVAPDGKAALEAIRNSRPTIVVSDLVMPEMGGLDLLKALRVLANAEKAVSA